MNIIKIGNGPVQIVWAHGWGMSGEVFRPIAESLASIATSYLIDFPGFGKTPPPPAAWGTEEYADYMAHWLHQLPTSQKRLWVGHSFGCRVGIRLAANAPDTISGMVLMGAAGLKRKRPFRENILYWGKIYAFKTLKVFVTEGPKRDALRARFGSADYKNAGILRPILLKVVNEDLSGEAKQIKCPTTIICGADDTETPPEISRRLNTLIEKSTLHILEGFDHYSILCAARHQVASIIKNFMDQL